MGLRGGGSSASSATAIHMLTRRYLVDPLMVTLGLLVGLFSVDIVLGGPCSSTPCSATRRRSPAASTAWATRRSRCWRRRAIILAALLAHRIGGRRGAWTGDRGAGMVRRARRRPVPGRRRRRCAGAGALGRGDGMDAAGDADQGAHRGGLGGRSRSESSWHSASSTWAGRRPGGRTWAGSSPTSARTGSRRSRPSCCASSTRTCRC